MKIKIIKRAERQKIEEKTPAVGGSDQTENDKARRAAATIKLWIEELRQSRERERLSLWKPGDEARCM